MAEKIKLVQGDTRPALVCTLTDENSSTAINLTGATCRMRFRAVGSTTIRSTLTGTVTDASNGVVEFYWASDPESLNGDPGDYEGEIEITFANGQVQTVYDLLKFKLREDF
jgi:hypothetical protein